MADSFCLFRIRAEGRDSADAVAALRHATLPAWQARDACCWGIWQGLFGIASNELFVVAAATGDRVLAPLAAEFPAGAAVTDTLELTATARPLDLEPPAAEGLYVFRFFDVNPDDCDEIVALSREAWETFEATDRYASRPLGLFRPRGPDGGADRMLLVTWYDGFASWETSRAPAPQARENFRRRHALTRGTVAYAARLVSGG